MIFLPPSVRGFQARYIVFSTWMDHLPFGYDLVDALRPSVVVELGTQAGLSYFVLCQSVAENQIPAKCFAVDTWRGDGHTGAYDDATFRKVDAHNSEHYSEFSTLLRMLFEEAVPRFDEESIDLLHIDGFHSYEAVRDDFETWYPKVRPGGVVIFHDVMARLADFGAWRFWREIAGKHDSFMFNHGFGLGVLRKPGGPSIDAPLLRLIFDGTPEEHERLRAFYIHAAEYQDLLRRVARNNKS